MLGRTRTARAGDAGVAWRGGVVATSWSSISVGLLSWQYLMSGHPEQWPVSPQIYVRWSDGQRCQLWQPEQCAIAGMGQTKSAVKTSAAPMAISRCIDGLDVDKFNSS